MKWNTEQEAKEYAKTLTEKKCGSEAEAKELVTELRNCIQAHDKLYYINARPQLSDFDYDHLYKKLKELERHYPQFITVDSPTQRITRSLAGDFETAKHLTPMLSLDNSYNQDDLSEFDRRVKELGARVEVCYTVEPKFDGSSISLVYENNMLVRAATRGDGTEGENITHNARAMMTIPLHAPFDVHKIYRCEIRGEVLIDSADFVKLNEEREAQNAQLQLEGKKELELFKNPRNTAAGSLRSKDPEEVRKRKLQAVMYHLALAEDAEGNNLMGSHLTSHFDNVHLLSEMGFKTPIAQIRKCNNINEVLQHINEWDTLRDSFPFEMDGMVVKADDLKLQTQIGMTSHHPRWAVAFKYKAKQALTQMINVEYQVGRTGAVTPVAKLSPVQLAGVTVSSVSLHNQDFIREKDLRIGDFVWVERAGEVIPYISAVEVSKRTGAERPVVFPKECPGCGAPLARAEDEAAWRCENAACPSQSEERLIHFVSKDCMDINGLGRDIIIRFLQEKIIDDIPSVYQIDFEKVLALPGWKDKSVNKLKESIEASKQQPLWRLVNGLGIRHVGTTMAKNICKRIGHISDLSDFTVERLMELEDVGPKVAKTIFDFFHNQKNKELIASLAAAGINLTNENKLQALSQKLEGKTFLFTGSLTKFTRDEAHAQVEAHGGKLLSSVSKNLNYLVAGENAGSKLEKAQKIQSIIIMTEDEFLAMIG